MNAGYGKNSPKVLNLTRAPDEFHRKADFAPLMTEIHETREATSAKGTKETKTDYLQKITKLMKVKLPDRPNGLFRLGPSLPSLSSVKRLVFVFFVSPALITDY
jgi:hypothetical protein